MTTSRIPNPIDLNGARFEAPGIRHGSGWTAPSRPRFELAFLTSGPPRLGLSEDDYRIAAGSLGIAVDALKTIAEVEFNVAAFDSLGRPTVRFESYHFHAYTSGRFDGSHPLVSSALPGGVGPLSDQYERLQEAYDLDPVAALKSAAWGRFEVMGSRYRASGCATVNHFVLTIAQSEAAHLTAFVSVVQSDKALQRALRANDWADFTMRYRM